MKNDAHEQFAKKRCFWGYNLREIFTKPCYILWGPFFISHSLRILVKHQFCIVGSWVGLKPTQVELSVTNELRSCWFQAAAKLLVSKREPLEVGPVDGRNPANQLIWRISQFPQGFIDDRRFHRFLEPSAVV